MRTLASVLVPLTLLACDPGPNYPPAIEFARAGCGWDTLVGDVVWWFEAEVTDPNGFRDVDMVWADVYEVAFPNAEAIDAFPLFSRRHGETTRRRDWYSDWLEQSTSLYCDDVDYEVDIVAYDREGELDVVTVRPIR